jgi:hypothetical protein
VLQKMEFKTAASILKLFKQPEKKTYMASSMRVEGR